MIQVRITIIPSDMEHLIIMNSCPMAVDRDKSNQEMKDHKVNKDLEKIKLVNKKERKIMINNTY